MIPPNSSGEFNGDGFGGNGSSTGTGLLVPPRTNLPADPMADWIDGSAAWTPETQHHGINPLEFLAGLKRQWLLAVGISGGLALAAMVAVFLLFPAQDEATAILRVSPVRPSYLEGTKPSQRSTPDEVQRTQENEQRFCKSDDVLRAVVREPKVKETKVMRAHSSEAIDFLKEELLVGFYPRSDYMYVTMRGEDKGELATIVDTVVNQYLQQGVYEEREKLRKKTVDLRGVVQQRQLELDAARKSAKAKAETLGVSTAANAKAANDLLFRDLEKVSKLQSNTEIEHGAAVTAFQLAQAELAEFKRRGVTDSMIDVELVKDPVYADMKAQMVQLETAYRDQMRRLPPGRRPSPSIQQLAAGYQEAQRQISEYRREAGKKIRKAFEERMETDIRLRAAQIKVLAQQAKQYKETAEEMLEDVKKKMGAAEELAADEERIARLVEFVNDKSAIIADLELELMGADRVELMQKATSPQKTSILRQVMITLGAGFITGCIGLCAVGGWEYFKRRLSSVGEVSKHLGLNLVGTVPALPSRLGKAAQSAAAEQFDAILADSIDSIRATLIHGAAGDGQRTLMITSAWDGEGKTTVASQLAASLARCGRRTLLVDADFRNPTLHELFDLPADVGLCEVLRGAVEPHAAIRETPADNLWLLSAGEFDHHSIQALENDAIGMLFRELKAEYDFVVIDTAPVLTVADAMLIGQHVDGAIVSTRLGFSQRPKIEDAVKRLRAVGVQVIGAVVNGTKPAKSRRAGDRPALVGAPTT